MTTATSQHRSAATLLAATLALGCFSERVSEPGDTTPCDGTVTPCAVQMRDNNFSPATARVTVGSTVRWTNAGASPHTSTSTTWDSGTLTNGQTFERAFPTAGSFGYQCIFHSGMNGTVLVE